MTTTPSLPYQPVWVEPAAAWQPEPASLASAADVSVLREEEGGCRRRNLLPAPSIDRLFTTRLRIAAVPGVAEMIKSHYSQVNNAGVGFLNDYMQPRSELIIHGSGVMRLKAEILTHAHSKFKGSLKICLRKQVSAITKP